MSAQVHALRSTWKTLLGGDVSIYVSIIVIMSENMLAN